MTHEQTSLFGNDEPDTHKGEVAVDAISVLLPAPLPGPLSYALPTGVALPPLGTLVRVNMHGRKLVGAVWDDEESGTKPNKHKLKMVEEILDVPPVTESLRKFITWVAAYTLSPPGMVLRMCLSAPDIGKACRMQNLVVSAGAVPDGVKLTSARQSVLDVAADGEARSVKAMAESAGVSDAVVRGLVKLNALITLQKPVDSNYKEPDTDGRAPKLSDEQADAAKVIADAVWQGGAAPILLDGVTGSGKTEVYFEGLVEALKQPGTQVLVLVPEISLTSQWLERFEARFGVKPVVWHSVLGQAERRRAWHAVAEGSARVVVGARSALFLPFAKLSLIVVDEEHDAGFKQEDGVMYHARDMAVVRGHIGGCPVVLASATPSLESLVNAEGGRYTHLKLRERHGGAMLPDMHAIDMRKHPPASGDWLSPVLAAQIDKALADGEQTILFLNRRGYAPLTLCRTCGHRIDCPNCSAWLVEHRYRRALQCHHCGFEAPKPNACPECDNEDTLVACGPGVERLAEEAIKRFPDARLAVMTSDTMTSPDKLAAMIANIEAGKVDIIIGTQIVTKGYHFPALTVVGVVDADLGLRGGDLRAGERTYQQLMQVAGRAGRADRAGRVYLQSFEPEHPVVQALLAGDGHAFMAQEADMRARHNMPPFGKLVALILSSPDVEALGRAGRALAVNAPTIDGVQVFGPAPAPITRIRGDYRYRMLLHAPKTVKVQGLVRDWLARAGRLKGIKLKVDVDPYSFM